MTKDPENRFSDCVDDYVRYRPGYPREIIPFLEKAIGLTPDLIIADIGSGTGKSSVVFLEHGCVVFGVEPNTPMRKAAEKLLTKFPGFRSINGKAEATTLDDNSVDLVVSGQAFHWFDPEKSAEEFRRILLPEGKTVLMWNTRNPENSPFMRDYDAFVSAYSDGYKSVQERRNDKATFDTFFGKGRYNYHSIPNFQAFTFEGLKGRYLSSSYAFHENHPKHKKAINSLREVFGEHEQNGKVKMIYKTELYIGSL